MKIEELYTTEDPSAGKPMTVSIRVNPASKITPPHAATKGGKSSMTQQPAGIKPPTRRTVAASNMKQEQLNKHEEMSYIEDAEANEAILKNTISKDELCRYLTPLKFMEIDTWRKEVPFGDSIDESEVEHRKWRTPVEILLPTSGLNDEGTASSQEEADHNKNDAARKKKATSAHNQRRKFFEEVQRQNAAVLQRSKSDATKLKSSRPRLREAFSAGEKQENRSQQLSRQGSRKHSSAESRLRTAYAPTNGIPSSKDIHAMRGPKHPGHIYVNNALSSGGQAAMMSYFAQRKPVSSKIPGRTKQELPRMNLADTGDYSTLQLTAKNRRLSQTSNSAMSPSSGQRISSSSWPGMVNEGSQRRTELMGEHEDIQVLPFDAIRPQTAGEGLLVRNRQDFYQKHSKVLSAQRSATRGLRSWNNRRSIENSLGAATKLYKNSLMPKRTPPTRILGKLRANKITNGAREESPIVQKESSSLGKPREQGGGGESSPSPEESLKPFSNNAMNISHDVSHSRKIKVRAFQVSKDKETVTRVETCPPIDVKITTLDNVAHASPRTGGKDGSTLEATNGLNYLKTDGIIELTPLQNGGISAPWVAETFSPALAANEGYYVRHQRQNKTVTFRLGAA